MKEQSDLKMWHEYALSLDDKLEHALRQIENQKSLMTCAADALDCHNLDHLQDDLIAELRKAAG
jgi:hypothetical protein